MSRLVRAELLKLTTVRTPWWFVAGVVLLAAATTAGLTGSGELDGDARVERLFEAASVSAIFATVIGLLVVTNEYRHGTITQTFLVTPVRERVVLAKLAAGMVAGLAYGLVAAATSLAVGLPWLAARDESAVVAGSGSTLLRLAAAYCLWAALGVAIGAVVRNQVGAIVLTFAWFLVVESLLTGLGILIWGNGGEGLGPIGPYLPGAAFDALVGGNLAGEQAGLLSPAAGLGLVLAYVGLVAAAGTALVVRRDPK